MTEDEIQALILHGDALMEDENLSAEELLAAADFFECIAEYLRINHFTSLEDAAAKGWGDTRPLRKETLQ